MGVEKDTTMRDELPDSAGQPETEQPNRSQSTYRSVAELAVELSLSERSTRDALRRGEIPHIRVGRRFILPKAAIAEWLRTAGRAVPQPGVATTESSEPVAVPSRAEVTVMRRAGSRQ